MATLRLLATNDLLGSISPLPASRGWVPGFEAVRAAVRELRTVPAIWVDAGDFAQGGPLAPLSGGRLGFEAAGELGIDVAAAGNHELDWGPGHLREQAALLPFPLLCANAPAGLPSTSMVATEAGPVGVIGLTHPDVATLAPGAPVAHTDPGQVRALATDLRRSGARVVVAAVHDGVDWVPTQGPPRAHPGTFRSRVAAWAPDVDAIVAGHTLARWIGYVGATPVLQPWAFGMEIGVLDLDLTRDGRVAAAPARAVRPARAGRWTGPGAAEADAAAATIVGSLDAPLAFAPGRELSLPDAIARSMQNAAESDAAFVDAGSCSVGQAPIDGVLAWMPAGPVTMELLLRMVPWQDEVVVGEIDARELARIEAAAARSMWGGAGWAMHLAAPRGGAVRLATGRYAGTLIDRWIGRPVLWSPIGVDVRTAFGRSLRAPAPVHGS